MKSIFSLLLVTLVVALCPGQALGRSVQVEATEMAVIRPSAESDELRLLLRFSMPEVLEGGPVDFACVSFEADCAGDEGAVSFQAFALTRSWDEETASWTGSWETPGGDWDRSLSAYWVGETGEGKTVQLDVTDFVNNWLAEPSENFGIVVKISGPFLGTFEVNAGSAPGLRILY